MLRTFTSVFPYTTSWAEGSLMLGSKVPFTLSQSQYEARRVAFEQFQWDLPTLKRIYSAGPDEIREFVGNGPISDRRQAGDRILPVAAQERRPRRIPGPAGIVRSAASALTFHAVVTTIASHVAAPRLTYECDCDESK